MMTIAPKTELTGQLASKSSNDLVWVRVGALLDGLAVIWSQVETEMEVLLTS